MAKCTYPGTPCRPSTTQRQEGAALVHFGTTGRKWVLPLNTKVRFKKHINTKAHIARHSPFLLTSLSPKIWKIKSLGFKIGAVALLVKDIRTSCLHPLFNYTCAVHRTSVYYWPFTWPTGTALIKWKKATKAAHHSKTNTKWHGASLKSSTVVGPRLWC